MRGKRTVRGESSRGAAVHPPEPVEGSVGPAGLPASGGEARINSRGSRVSPHQPRRRPRHRGATAHARVASALMASPNPMVPPSRRPSLPQRPSRSFRPSPTRLLRRMRLTQNRSGLACWQARLPRLHPLTGSLRQVSGQARKRWALPAHPRLRRGYPALRHEEGLTSGTLRIRARRSGPAGWRL